MWTDRWMRALTWRELQRLIRHFREVPAESSLECSRERRLDAEMKRRRREGRGGWASGLRKDRNGTTRAAKARINHA
jgi:hypothetical protein